MEEFNLDLPYPEVCGEITPKELGELYDLYAGRFSELTAITSYVYQSIICGDKELCEVLLKISVTEMEHCEMLGKSILVFGADPVFAGRFNFRIYRIWKENVGDLRYLLGVYFPSLV